MTQKNNSPSPKRLRLSLLRSSLGTRLTFNIGLVVTITSLALFIGIYRLEEKQAIQQVHTEAQALLSEMIVVREWVSQYGGVWTRNSGDYYLDTEKGFFLKSPAMVTKELSNLSNARGDYRFHITSLILTNPENVPDDFEHNALVQFEESPTPITSIERSGDGTVYRLMFPLMVEESCLACHEEQGYQSGDVRGGLSVLVPMSGTELALANSRQALTLAAISIISLVMIALYIMIRQMVIAPVGQLKTLAAAVSAGNFEARCTIQTGDELEILGQTFNQMIANLKVSQDSLNNRIAQRTQELNVISDVALIISRAGALEDILAEALGKVIAVAGAAGGIIQLVEDENTWLTVHTGLSPGLVNCFEQPRQKNVSQCKIQQASKGTVAGSAGEYVRHKVTDAGLSQIREDCPAIANGYSQAVSVPLDSRSRSLGVITLFSVDSSSFSPEIMQLLECISRQLGVAVENARFHQRAEQMAILEERTRISRELHDSLAQTLGWLRIKTEMLADDLQLGEMERAQTDLASIQRVVRDASYDVRESIDGLRTQPQGSLTATAAAWIAEFRQRSGLCTDFRAQDSDVRIFPVVEVELLRIMQEALTNVRKHAQAQCVQVALRVKGNFAELIIEDDGRGFAYSTNPGNDHFGLRIMRERTERLGGAFRVASASGQGTKITALLPLFPSARIGRMFEASEAQNGEISDIQLE